MKKHTTTILLFVVMFVGLALMLYPPFADYYNSSRAFRTIATYTERIESDAADYTAYWEAAEAYNEMLSTQTINMRMYMAHQLRDEYNSLLNIDGSGMMGIMEIPEIAVTLPIYHSTSDVVLQVAIGHLEGTSLPTGTPGTHSAFSAHRGLPSAKLFTNLDQLTYGDVFTLRVLDRILTYEIDQILIVLPHEIESLEIEPGKDYCTLVTCTPYGINSHRLLIRGHRVENSTAAQAARVTADAMQIDPLIVTPIVAAPMLLVLLVIMLVSTSPKKKQKKAALKQFTAEEIVRQADGFAAEKNEQGGERL